MAIVAAALLTVAAILGCDSDGAQDSPPPEAFSADTSIDPADKPLPPLQRPRVRIEKSARRLLVFDGDRIAKTYRAASGSADGDKAREGDRRTPEGSFYICMKNPQSKYLLSLGLSYPNIEDAERGLADALIDRGQYERIISAIGRKAQPPWYTPLGGEIMIHGHGAATNWTAGCVALSNDDITELYRALPVGTPVEIVP